jgi:hypothetical protein
VALLDISLPTHALLMPSHVNRLNALMSMENDEFIQSEEIDDRTQKNACSFQMSDRMENVCSECKQVAWARGGRCCDGCANEKRRKKPLIHSMELTML